MHASAHSPASLDRPVVVVAGPTAGGKSALAVQLAQGLPDGGECINADSMQVYRGMDIGTAKPSMAERCGIPHHLIDVAQPNEPFTLDTWHAMANEAVQDIRSRGKWPVLVGGTNLYVQAFLYGMLDAPGPDASMRANLDTLEATQLRAQLEIADAEAAKQIHPNDRRRMIRALEVAASGTTISSLQTQWTRPPRNDALLIALQWPTDIINSRINARVRTMVDAGLIDEIRSLAPTLGPQAAAALGYKQVLSAIDGSQADLDTALEQVKIRTRRFAKGQRTWLRRFKSVKVALWLEPALGDAQSLYSQAINWVLQQPPSQTNSTKQA